jgi:hypothetical protein
LNDGFGHFTRAAGAYPSSEIHLCYDSDEDGKIDLTMTYQDGGGQWWRNRSKPNELLFEPTGITRGTNTARRQAMIDINRDGHVDRARTDTTLNSISAMATASSPRGARLAVTQAGTRPLLPCDIDGDGTSIFWPNGATTRARGQNRRISATGLRPLDVTAEADCPGRAPRSRGSAMWTRMATRI